jgi:hypothetical protein
MENDILKDLKNLRRHCDRLIRKYSQLVTITTDEVGSKSDNLSGINEFAQSLLITWNEGVEAKCRVTEDVKRRLKTRLNSFSKSEIEEAVINRVNFVTKNSWHNEKKNRPHKINIDIVLRSDADLDKWLNSKDEPEEIRVITLGDGARNMLD